MSTPVTTIGNSTTSLASPEAPLKRRRLNFACNYCRSRKSRCDEQKPSCRACLAAGVPCVTVDRRRPGVEITRHEAGAPPNTPKHVQASGVTVQAPCRRPSAAESARDFSPVVTTSTQQQTRPGSKVPLTPQSASEAQEESHHTAATWRPQRRANDRNADFAADIHAETDHVNQTTKFSGRLPILKPSSGSCTAELLTDWLDLAFHRLGIKKRLKSLLTLPESHAGPPQPLLRPDLPPLPDTAASQELLFIYLEEVNAACPLLDAAKTSQMLDIALQLGPTQFARDHGFLPLLIIYLILGLGALSHGQPEWREFSASNLDFCKSFVGHMIGWNTLQSVQLMLLMSLSLKAHDQVSACWSAMSLCVSMALSQGLNRPGSPPRRSSTQLLTRQSLEVDRLRTWWCIYCFERVLAFDLGKPPLIIDESCHEIDIGSWSFSTNGRSHPRPTFLRILGQFSDLVGEIGRSAIRSRNTEETAGSSGIDGAIRDKVKTIGESCLMLMKWADSLPDEYRPRSDFIYDSGSFPYASYIALQYNQALLMLMRNSLLVSNKAIQIAIDNVAAGTPWEHIIRNGHTIALNAARRIIQLLIEASDSGMKPLLPTLAAPLHALYVLSINILRHPTSRMAKSDLNLIHDAADFAKQQDELSNTDNKLQSVLDKLDLLVKKVMTSASSTPRIIAMQKSGTATPSSQNVSNVVPGSTVTRIPAGQCQSEDPSQTFNAQSFEQMDMSNIDFAAVFGESPALSQDADLSPEGIHDIGWDWVDFTQLFPESLDVP